MKMITNKLDKTTLQLLTFGAVFATTIFLQCIIFHYLFFNELLLSSLWKNPTDFIRFYLPHISIAMFFSSFVFLFKNKWWTVGLSIIFNIWIWANLWYYRANNILIDKYSIKMIGNLNGFFDSILALIKPQDYIFLSISIILMIYIYIRNRIIINQ